MRSLFNRWRSRREHTIAVLVVAVVAAALAVVPALQSPSQAATGDLDLTFGGGDGIVNTDFGTLHFGVGYETALQPDGKILAATRTTAPTGELVPAVVRLDTNGALDRTFGRRGVVLIEPAGASSATAESLSIQPDGRILVGYTAEIGPATGVFAIARLTPAGALDPTFDTDGRWTADPSTGAGRLADIAVQTDGRVLAAGYTQTGAGDNDMVVYRVTPAGATDTTFDGDGFATYGGFAPAGAPGSNDDLLRAIALQADGKIVVAGSANSSTIGYGFALARINPSGALDGTFDGDGRVFTRFQAGPGFDDRANDVAIESDGQIVAVGGSDICNGGSGQSIAVARYNTNGSLDPLFASGGLLKDCPGDNVDEAFSVAIQSDGAILAGGHSYDGSLTQTDTLITRYTSLGNNDLTFNAPNGFVRTGGVDGGEAINSLALLGDGRIVASGVGYVPTDNVLQVQRYTSLGALDTTFDTDGTRLLGSNRHRDTANDVLRQDDGKIVIAGQGENGANSDFALARFNADGSLDPTFGDDGTLLTDFNGGFDEGFGFVRQTDGKYVVVGTARTGTGQEVALARYTAAGVLDPAFDGDGRVVTNLSTNFDDVAAQVALQPDGKIVVVGTHGDGYAFVARYLPSGTLDTTFDGDGVALFDPGAGQELAIDLGIQPDGKVVIAGYRSLGADDDVFVARFLNSGPLDTGFSGDGYATLNPSPGDDLGSDVAIQPDGRIVVAGQAQTGAAGASFLARYTATGAPDTTFSGDGLIIDDISASGDAFFDIAFDNANNIVVSGATNTGAGGGHVLVARYTPAGVRDPGFHDDGLQTIAAQTATGESGDGVAVTPNGDILITGESTNARGDRDMTLIRLTGDLIAPTLDLQVDTDVIPASPSVFDPADIPWSPSTPALAGSPVIDPGLIDFPVIDPGLIGFPVIDPGLIDFPVIDPGLIDFPVIDPGLIDFPVLRTTTLAQIPLVPPTKWEEVVPDVPLTSTTLADVLALDPVPPALAQLKLSDIDWSGVALRTLSAVSLAAGKTTFAHIAPPSGGPDWCQRFAALGYGNCGAAFGGTGATVLMYEMFGGDVAGTQLPSFKAGSFSFHPAAPVAEAKLADVEQSVGLRNGALGAILLTEIPAATRDLVVDCARISCANGKNLADAAAAGALRADGKVRDLGSVVNADGTVTPTGRLAGFSYGEVVASLLPANAYDIEHAPLDQVPLELLDGPAGEVSNLTYTLAYTNNSAAPVSDVTASLTTFAGSAYMKGSATRAVNGQTPVGVGDPAIDGQVLTFSFAGPVLSGETVTWTVKVRPGLSTGGPFGTDAVVRAGTTVIQTLTAAAPVTVIDAFEDDDVAAEATLIEANRIYAPHMDGDLDWFKIAVPVGSDGKALVGSHLRVLASHLPVDVDVVTYLDADSASAFRSTPPPITINGSPVIDPGLIDFPVEDRPPALETDLQAGATQALEDIPVDSTRTVAGYSANRGLMDEIVDVVVPENAQAGDYVYIQFSGFLQASSPEPYYFRVMAQPATSLPPCSPIKFGTPGEGVATIQGVVPNDTETLFLVSGRRLGNMYGRTRATQVAAAISDPAFLGRADVKGAVVSLDTGANTALAQAFAAYDQNSCSAAVTNELVTQIIARLDSFLTAGHNSLKRIQIVGSTEIIPSAMYVDRTLLVNERGYEEVDFTTRDRDANGNPVAPKSNNLHSGVRKGFVFSDAPYGDFAATAYPGGTVPVPEVAVARQLETPEDIVAGVQRFVQRNGTLDLAATRLFSAGSEFANDAAQAVDSAFAANFPNAPRTLLTGEQWSADDAKREFATATDKPGAAALAGHQNHYSWQAGNGSMLYSKDTSGSFQDRLIISSSCHGALGVADTLLAFPTQPGATANRLSQSEALKDWPQTYGSAAAFMGPTGYSYGDRNTVGWTERLMAMVAGKVRNGASIGSIMVDSVQEYAATTGVTDVYDVKVLQEWALSGLSMYHVGPLAPQTTPLPNLTIGTDPALGGEEYASLDVSPNLQLNGPAGAQFYTDGAQLPETTQYQPVTAKSVVDVTREGKVLSGVLLTEMTESPVIGGFEPATATPLVGDNDADPSWTGMAFPASPIADTTGTVRTSAGLRNLATLLPTRFVATGDGVGRLHRYSNVKAEAFYAPVGTTPGPVPEFRRISGTVSGPNSFTARVESVDVAELYTVLYRDGLAWKRLDLTNSCGPTCREGTATVSIEPSKVEFIAQLVGTGPGRRVAYSTNKAMHYSVDTTPPQITIRAPLAGGSYSLGVDYAADYSCSDDNGVTSCAGTVANGSPIDTATFGDKVFTVTATDTAGNTTTKTVTYHVDSYSSTGEGMLPPLNKSNTKITPQKRGGVPIKFKLEGDEPNGFATSKWTVKRQEVACLAPSTLIGPEFAVTGISGSTFKYSDDTYHFNADFKDPLLTNRCFYVRVYLDDPAPVTYIQSSAFQIT